jgi:hypothetical protein
MTKNQKNLKRAGIITSTFLAAATVTSFASTPNNSTGNSDLLDFEVLGSATEIMVDVSAINGNMYRTLELKCGEGKCGEGKCGEGKCGAESKEKKESAKKEKTESAKREKATEAKAKRKASKKTKKVKKTEGGF